MSVSLDSGGWTVVGPSADTQTVYVSSSAGNDANSGRSAASPVKTVAKGRSLLRNGMPDHMLLKRGDAWYEPLSPAEWTLSGRDADEPMLIGTYGDASAARPVLKTGAKRGFDLNGKPVHDLVIQGLHFQAHTRDPDASEYTGSSGGDVGVRLVGAAKRILVEDTHVESYQQNVSVMDWNGRPSEITVRRNVIVDAYATSSSAKSQGMYVTSTDGITIEGNVFDHNGWDARVSWAVASQYNHNLYLQPSNTGVVVRDNIIANGSSHGVQARSGGEIRNNLFLRNAVGLSFGFVNGAEVKAGGVTGTVDGNVFLDSHDINGVARGWGVELNNTRAGADVGVRNNIFAHDTRGTGHAIRFDTGEGVSNASQGVGLNDLTVEDNIVYKWFQGMYTNAKFVPGGTGLTGFNDVTVRNNDFQQISATKMVRHEGAVSSEESWGGNRYADSNLSPSEWFQIGSTRTSFDSWRGKVEPTAANANGAYADPNRTISTYNASLGGGASLTAFLGEARKQRQGSFRGAYTSAAAINYFRRGFAEGGVIPGGEVAVPAGNGGGGSTAPAPAPDTTAPTVATFAAADVTTAGGTTHTVTVTYRDDRAISVDSVGNGDVQVTGPVGYSQTGTLVTAQASTDGTAVTAQYRVGAPGGSWDAVDNGTYTLAVRANEVRDAAGNVTAAGTLGTFTANVTASATTPVPPPPAGTPAVLRANADGYVRDGSYATANYGTGTELIAKKANTAGSSRESLLRFDLSAVSAVTSAKLRLNGRLANTNDPVVETTVYNAPGAAWTESGLTWNTKPAAGPAALGTIAVSGTTNKWYELDLTSFLQAERAAGRNSVTLVLKNAATSNAEIKFNSDEATANRPELMIG